MKYGSVCSGIESATAAWESLGWEAAWFSEIEPFPCAVLAHHYPHVANLGDMTHLPDLIRGGLVDVPDILVGGTPCQAFSVAGKKGSLADERGGLSLIYGDLLNAIDEQRPGNEAIAVWENVPGVLSTKDNAFGYLLGLLAGEFTLVDCLSGRAEPLEAQPGASRQKWPKSGCVIGPQRTVAWRVIDAQYFGLAQRRKRVFVVASARDGFDPATVLFERESVRRDIAPSRETQPPIAALTANGVGTCGADDNQAQAGHLIATGHRMVAFGEYAQDQTASTMKARDYKDATDLVVHGTQDPCVSDNLAFSLGRNNGGENVVAFSAKDNLGDLSENVSPTLRACGSQNANQNSGHWVAIHENNNAEVRLSSVTPTINTRGGKVGQGYQACFNGSTVRRLTPIECERLQGFPDDYTNVPYRNKPAADGPRYKALGNSKATNCVQWLGVRIQLHLWGLI